MRQVTIGCELECGLVDPDGLPADTVGLLGDGRFTGRAFEGVTSDLGRSSFEIISTVCTDQQSLEESLNRCADLAPEDHTLRYNSQPFGPKANIAAKPRYFLVNEALNDEHPDGNKSIYTVAPWCSTQFHIGIGDVLSDGAVLLLNFLNSIGPYARQQVIKRYRIQDPPGQLTIWQGWSRPERVPAPRWFSSGEAVTCFVNQIPKLVTKKNGQWIKACGARSQLGDLESEGTIWWLARPRAVYQTIEWRPFPSLTPQNAAQLGGDVLELVRAFWDFLDARATISRPPLDRHTIGELYDRLSWSYLVPERQPTDDEWWDLYVE